MSAFSNLPPQAVLPLGAYDLAELRRAVETYEAALADVRETDLGGDNEGAATMTLSGRSATRYAQAQSLAAADVRAAQDKLTERVDAADDLLQALPRCEQYFEKACPTRARVVVELSRSVSENGHRR
jgi:hypothetical protein